MVSYTETSTDPSFGYLQGKLDPEYSCQYRWTLVLSLASHGAHTIEVSPSLFRKKNLGELLSYPAISSARKGNVCLQATAGLPLEVCRQVPLIHLSDVSC